MKISINNKAYEVHFSLRSQMMWEQHYEKKFNPRTIEEVMSYYYFAIYACNDIDGEELTFEKFLEAIEKDSTLVDQLIEAMSVKKKPILHRVKVAMRILMG